MKPDWETVSRQYNAARRAMETFEGDAEMIKPLQKVYDLAKAQYEGHEKHPDNRAKKRQAAKKRF